MKSKHISKVNKKCLAVCLWVLFDSHLFLIDLRMPPLLRASEFPAFVIAPARKVSKLLKKQGKH